jgi:hypothetical protein
MGKILKDDIGLIVEDINKPFGDRLQKKIKTLSRSLV